MFSEKNIYYGDIKIFSRVPCKLTSPKYGEAAFKSALGRYEGCSIIYLPKQERKQ